MFIVSEISNNSLKTMLSARRTAVFHARAVIGGVTY